MGIRYLNRFLEDNCLRDSIKKTHLSKLKNKVMVVDTSIYLYRFLSENLLIENMYSFISILKKYKIKPIFIFDGKPPSEKKELLQQRRAEKKKAEEKYIELNNLLLNQDNEDKKKIVNEMEKLKRTFVKINDEDVKRVKILMDAFGVNYYDAPGEADQLCGYLVKKNKAWGCISDDTDMFLYGCNYILRNINLLKHTCILYDKVSILKDLEMSENIFCEIMILSGTDYNIHSKTSLKETIRWYYKYLDYYYRCKKDNKIIPTFYTWLVQNTKYITDYNNLLKIYQIFNNDDLKEWDNMEIPDKKMDLLLINEIMKKC
uniref:XPG N-terminal domain-containing protein n=1 Tax=viral metagenome TaxID=1070528 RepID=A0A6C0HT09_9ZZZZ